MQRPLRLELQAWGAPQYQECSAALSLLVPARCWMGVNWLTGGWIAVRSRGRSKESKGAFVEGSTDRNGS